MLTCALEAPVSMGDTASLSPPRDAWGDAMGAAPGAIAPHPLQQTSLSFLDSSAENLLELFFAVLFEGK